MSVSHPHGFEAIGFLHAVGNFTLQGHLCKANYVILVLPQIDAVGESKFMLPVERSAIWALLSVGLHAASQGHVIGLWQLP